MWPSTIAKSDTQPTVSILTPTYNRRKFISQLATYILEQTYPRARMEWVILDDGTDPIEDLITPYKSQIEIQYIRSDTKLNIGAKRNRLHAAARGDVLVCMDDDDYYPPERVSHAITTLRGKKVSICGSSRNHLYFTDDRSIWAVGPYTANHATFGTMAFTKKYAMTHPCDETVLNAEEIAFTRRYSEPLAQLDPFKTMLVLCHSENTFNKHNLRSPENPAIKKTAFTLKTFVSQAKHRAFYTNP
jgi:glycosyltransferase involved in cell wall biosynthesis